MSFGFWDTALFSYWFSQDPIYHHKSWLDPNRLYIFCCANGEKNQSPTIIFCFSFPKNKAPNFRICSFPSTNFLCNSDRSQKLYGDPLNRLRCFPSFHVVSYEYHLCLTLSNRSLGFSSSLNSPVQNQLYPMLFNTGVPNSINFSKFISA